LSRDIWEKVKRSELPQVRKPIKVKWIFKIKNEHDGTIRLKSRIVVKGYSQQRNILTSSKRFFNKNHANDHTHQERLGNRCGRHQSSFLEADLDEDVYIEWPEGLKELGFTTQELEDQYCIKLGKAMYGTVQVPRSLFLTFSKLLKSPPLNMSQSQQDPCLWYRKDLEGNTILIVGVHDCLVCGKWEVIEWWRQNVKKKFNISDLGKISKHISVWYEEGQDEYGKFLKTTMDSYCDDCIKQSEDFFGEVRKENMPAYPGKVLSKKKEDEQTIDNEQY